jgi:t-SNARE complex subunit (syntaxin)
MTPKQKAQHLEDIKSFRSFQVISRERTHQKLRVIYSFIPKTDKGETFYQRFASVKGGDQILYNYALSQEEVTTLVNEMDRPKKLSIVII